MAAGCFPVAGDIASIREWIEHGCNGFLCDPGSPEALADATVRAIADPEMRRQAAERNRELIAKRAEHSQVMKLAEQFYARVLAASSRVRYAQA